MYTTLMTSLLSPVLAASGLAQSAGAYENSNVELVLGMLLFIAAGFALVFGGLSIGRIARPRLPHPEKASAYECG